MVIQFIIGAFFVIMEPLFFLLPDVDVSWLNSADTAVVFDYINVILYLFPVKTLVILFGIFLAVHAFRIYISVLKTAMDIIPFA